MSLLILLLLCRKKKNILEMSTIKMIIILAFKGVSTFFQIHKDNLIQNKISENI